MKDSKCPVCNKPVLGRSDKKFCSPRCKSLNQYDGRLKNEKFYFQVDKQLKTNRKLLKKYNRSGYTTLRSSKLYEEGFNPNFFTHYWKNQKGDVYLFCYDFGFLSLEKGSKRKYVIVQWQDYMTNK